MSIRRHPLVASFVEALARSLPVHAGPPRDEEVSLILAGLAQAAAGACHMKREGQAEFQTLFNDAVDDINRPTKDEEDEDDV